MEQIINVILSGSYGQNGEKIGLFRRYTPRGYATMHSIGNGPYAHTFTTIDRQNDDNAVVVKLFHLENMSEEQTKALLREWNCLRICRHPNIVTLLDAFAIGPMFYMIQEQMDTDLKQFIKTSPHHNKTDVFGWIAVQLLHALVYLKNSRIVHKDINPANIGFNSTRCTVKLLDLGIVRHAQKNQEGWATYRGSPLYMAPEALFGIQRADYAADVWSLFATLCELPLRRPLFHAHGISRVSDLKSKLVQVCGSPGENDNDARLRYPSFVCQTKKKKSIRRMIPIDVFEWKTALKDNPDTVEQFYNLLENVFTFDYIRRHTAEDCLHHPFLTPYKAKYCELLAEPRTSETLLEELESLGKVFEVP